MSFIEPLHYVLLNYFLDGPCGDCPKKFQCEPFNTDLCVHYEAWNCVEIIVYYLSKKVVG